MEKILISIMCSVKEIDKWKERNGKFVSIYYYILVILELLFFHNLHMP